MPVDPGKENEFKKINHLHGPPLVSQPLLWLCARARVHGGNRCLPPPSLRVPTPDGSRLAHHQAYQVPSPLVSDAKAGLSSGCTVTKKSWRWLSTFNEDSVSISPFARHCWQMPYLKEKALGPICTTISCPCSICL